MDRETIERLLIDRRLGELPPDTHRLLEAYLQISPADAAAHQEIDAIIDRATQALRLNTTVTTEVLPPPAWKRDNGATAIPHSAFCMEFTRRGGHSAFRNRLRPLALAASILLAFFLGTRWVQRPGAPMDRNTQITNALSSSSLKPQVEDSTGRASSLVGTDFWSVTRYASPRGDRARSQLADSPRIEWTSPLIWPHPGEKL